MIGGSDKVLWVPEKAPAAKLILKSVRRHWPKFVFQDADDDLPLDPAKLPSLPVPKGREFFLYRDMKAAKEWLKSGATLKNKNTLIYVILGKRRKRDLGLRSITLVGGAWTGVLGTILADIQAAFDGCRKNGPPNGQVAPLSPMPHAVERE
jgi:hypothetical protein